MASGFKQLGERTVHDGSLVAVQVGTFAGPDGERFERDVVRHPGAVSIVPVHDDRTVTLVRQYRAAVDRELLEIPAGKRDQLDEAPAETAQRELAEEVGLRADRIDLLAEFYNSPGFCDEHSFVFLGRDLSAADADLQGPEEQAMVVERYALDDVPGMIADASIVDAKTIIGLTLTLRHLG